MFPFLGLAPHASKLSLKICSVMNMFHIGIILIVIIGGLVDQQLVTYEVYMLYTVWHRSRMARATTKVCMPHMSRTLCLLRLIKELDNPLCPHSGHHYCCVVDILVGAVRNIASSVFRQCTAPSCSSVLSVFCSV